MFKLFKLYIYTHTHTHTPCFDLFSHISKELERNFVSFSLQYRKTREKFVNFKDDVFSGL